MDPRNWQPTALSLQAGEGSPNDQLRAAWRCDAHTCNQLPPGRAWAGVKSGSCEAGATSQSTSSVTALEETATERNVCRLVLVRPATVVTLETNLRGRLDHSIGAGQRKQSPSINTSLPLAVESDNPDHEPATILNRLPQQERSTATCVRRDGAGSRQRGREGRWRSRARLPAAAGSAPPHSSPSVGKPGRSLLRN